MISRILGEKRSKNLLGVEISFYEISLGGILHRFLICHDAECFSEAVLRSLLLSDCGEQILSATAISFSEASVRIRSVSLDDQIYYS